MNGLFTTGQRRNDYTTLPIFPAVICLPCTRMVATATTLPMMAEARGGTTGTMAFPIVTTQPKMISQVTGDDVVVMVIKS